MFQMLRHTSSLCSSSYKNAAYQDWLGGSSVCPSSCYILQPQFLFFFVWIQLNVCFYHPFNLILLKLTVHFRLVYKRECGNQVTWLTCGFFLSCSEAQEVALGAAHTHEQSGNHNPVVKAAIVKSNIFTRYDTTSVSILALFLHTCLLYFRSKCLCTGSHPQFLSTLCAVFTSDLPALAQQLQLSKRWQLA